MVEDIFAHQTVVSGYLWEQEWECVGTYIFLSILLYCFNFWPCEYIYVLLM